MPDQFDSCEREIHQLLTVQAQVKVTPLVRHGAVKVHCIDSCMKPRFDCGKDERDDFHCFNDHDRDFTCGPYNNCEFTLTQLISVEIPISFDADVDIKKGILCCGEPHIKPDCSLDSEDDINRDPIYILMNNKTQF